MDLYVIDTDCGGDDAMALALGFRAAPDRILAVTCCTGNTQVDNVCDNVRKVMVAYGMEDLKIPVHKGCDRSLLGKEIDDSADVHGPGGLGDCGDDWSVGGLAVEGEAAAAAIARLASTYPGRIVLLCLAPLTNVALAMRLDPRLTQNLKRIVCMGGNYKGIGNITETAEYNFFFDPESAQIVLSESQCEITLVPWETTTEFGIEWDDYYAMVNGPSSAARFLRSATAGVERYCRGEGDPMFLDCDFLASAAAFRPESVAGEFRARLGVECRGDRTRGMAVRMRSGAENVRVVTKFHPDLLWQARSEIF